MYKYSIFHIVARWMYLYQCNVWKLNNSTQMDMKCSTELHINPLALHVYSSEKQERLIDWIIHTAEWIKSIITMC